MGMQKMGHWRWLSVCLSAPLFQFFISNSEP